MKRLFSLVGLILLAAGCATNYSWRSRIPQELRTVYVPTFENVSDVVEAGAVVTRQVLREFQREGTFSIAGAEDAALEIQGVVNSLSMGRMMYSRRTWSRVSASEVSLVANISVIDRKRGIVLIDNKTYEAVSTTTTGLDTATSLRDATSRLADDLSRQVVDDVLNLKW